jgi:drug/metabolite transporter (DMT)-like permease
MVKTSALRMTPVEWGLLFILGGFWGCTFFFNEIALRELPPFSIICFRVGLASLILWLIVWMRGVAVPRHRDVWIALTVMAAINSAVPFFLIAWGQVHITGGLASILIATSPLFAVVAAHYCTQDEGLTPGKVIGVIAGLVGVVFLLGPELLGDLGGNLLGQLSVLGAAICYAGSAIYGRRFAARGVSPIIVATGQMSMATVLLLPFALVVDQPWNLVNPGLPVWGAVLSLAVLSTEQVIGMAFIVVGLITIDGRILRRLQITG